MELVLETLKEKKFYLEYKINSYSDYPEIIESLKESIKDFEQAIDTIELYIQIKKK